MARITKSLSAKVDKQTGKSEILFRFIGGYRIEFKAKSGIFINPKQWNPRTKELKTATFGAGEVNVKKRLDSLCNTIIEEFTSTDKDIVSKEWLCEVIDRFHFPDKYIIREEKYLTFLEGFEYFIEVHKVSDVRKKNFKVIYRALKRYSIYNDVVLEFNDFTNQTLREIEQFLRDEHKLCEKPKYKKILEEIPEYRTPMHRGQNTINDIFGKIRTFWRWAVDEGIADNKVKIEVQECVYGTPFYITVEERKIIEQVDLSSHPSLAVQRDIFIFQCCIGCRIGDLYKMTKNNVINGAIHYVPRKTKEGNPVTVAVPLNETAKTILDRYVDLKEQRILPFISQQNYNVAIKEIFKEADITRTVLVRNALTGESEPRPINEVASSHLARRTFVGNIYKQVKDPNLVGALSGHKEGSRAFARYRDIDEEMKKDLVKLLD